MIELLKGLLQSNAVRLAGYASTAAVAGALYISAKLGLELSAEALVAIGAFAAAVAIEGIRLLVFSFKTTQEIANKATFQKAGTIVDIGKPPEGDK